ncbi:MAG TPA: cytochrome c, partial [Planctomycetota bacterium]|nr:cytochrome c [Planctomycetota bacterium]
RRGRAEEVAALDELARAARVPEHAQALDAGAAGVAAAARARPASRLPDDPQARARIERGKGLFVVCAGCHGMKGEGTGEAPPLVGSGRLGGPAEVAIRIVLFGSQGERSMPALALGDEDVAAVLSYARHAFAGASVVEPGEVRALR